MDSSEHQNNHAGKTVLLANGEFPHSYFPMMALSEASRVVCCDGAVYRLMSWGRQPDVVIGDMDSIREEDRKKFGDRVVHIAEQDTNDLCKAFRYCIQQGWRDLVILGATGKREDHTLGNLSHFVDFAKEIPDLRLITDEGEFRVLYRSGSIPTRIGQQISIFAMSPDTPLESRGLKWPLNGLTPSRWWQATLNEATDTTVFLSFPEDHPVMVFLAKVDRI